MARTDTLLFHKALAVVGIWILAWAVAGYLNHRAVPPFDQRDGYRDSMQQCADYRLDPSRNGEWTSRAPGRLEMAACTARIRSRYRQAEDAEQRQVAVGTLAWALLPSLLLLLLAAFAPELRRQFPRRSDRR
jgi:hypothetical protein